MATTSGEAEAKRTLDVCDDSEEVKVCVAVDDGEVGAKRTSEADRTRESGELSVRVRGQTELVLCSADHEARKAAALAVSAAGTELEVVAEGVDTLEGKVADVEQTEDGQIEKPETEERSSGDSGENTDPASSAQLRASILQVRKVRRQAKQMAKQRRAEVKRARQQRQAYQGEHGNGERNGSKTWTWY
ncbi:hypothetical protein DVH05_006714 [Phytophthora capsici]|nr:hypothetical protein DVH05_006714 [Phytophthora capsici]